MAQEIRVQDAWGVKSLSKLHTVSFQNVVDETLAQKLQFQYQEKELIPVGNDMDADFAFALHLQENDSADEEKIVAEKNKQAVDTDGDLALAMHLQAQEEECEARRRKKERKVDSLCKVRVAEREQPNVTHSNVDLMRFSSMSIIFDANSPQVLTEDSSLSNPDAEALNSRSNITKHNEEACGRKNANRIEKRHDIIVGDDIILSKKTYTDLNESLRREKVKGVKVRGKVEKESRATRQSVLDDRTRLLLFKMSNVGILDVVHGIVGTGKESNVYYVTGIDEDDHSVKHYAAKVFKTTLNEFSNRSVYVNGDSRYGNIYSTLPAEKQISFWCKKEFSNLYRAHRAGISVPFPYQKKKHILLMDFIGLNGWPAPQLRQVTLDYSRARDCYIQIIITLRKLYQQAHLVHADLSEYNILYYQKKCWLIDFGQAVERTHPQAAEFLYRDIATINNFFKRIFGEDEEQVVDEELDIIAISPGAMTDQEIFLYVTETSIGNVEKIVLPYDLISPLMQEMVNQQVIVAT